MDWVKTVGPEWYDLLKDFLESDKMKRIVSFINSERNKYIVYPLKEDFHKMFKVFRDLQPSNIKVIIFGQDPFHDGSYTGYAFDNGGKLPSKISPSLRNILEEIKNNDTEKENICLDEMDLSRWVKQGVFLINTFLTVRKGQPGMHKFWQPFTNYWVEKLNNYNDIVWLLWGTIAHKNEVLIKNKSHEIIKTSHPSPLGYKKESNNFCSFYNSKCFSKVNHALWARNKNMVKW